MRTISCKRRLASICLWLTSFQFIDFKETGITSTVFGAHRAVIDWLHAIWGVSSATGLAAALAESLELNLYSSRLLSVLCKFGPSG